jgi:hypothetical protein
LSFKADHPDYASYQSDDYHVDELPPSFGGALQGFITRHCGNAQELKAVINDIAGRIPCEPTNNWGWDFLIGDLSHYVDRLCKGKMHKVMDFLADLCAISHLSFNTEDLNEFLEDLEVGYEVEGDNWGSGATWHLRKSVSTRTEAVDAASEHVKDVCEQALDHLIQAREHLVNTQTDRDRKDAVRDCLSALEALLKVLSGKSDIKDATTELREAKTWGPDTIVKDGLSLWNRMHELYPDIRHGQSTTSVITDEEALYWTERITCFIRYMANVHRRSVA